MKVLLIVLVRSMYLSGLVGRHSACLCDDAPQWNSGWYIPLWLALLLADTETIPSTSRLSLIQFDYKENKRGKKVIVSKAKRQTSKMPSMLLFQMFSLFLCSYS